MRGNAATILVVLMTVWAGIIVGVSLIATPIKFQAPSLTLETGVEVGRYTFRFLAWVEIWLLIASAIAAVFAQARGMTLGALIAVAVLLLVQRFWLLPILDARVAQRLAGETPSFSNHHTIYAGMEVIKTVLLIAGAVIQLRLG